MAAVVAVSLPLCCGFFGFAVEGLGLQGLLQGSAPRPAKNEFDSQVKFCIAFCMQGVGNRTGVERAE